MENEQNIKCPICEESFMDMRGITSHARHVHDLSREQVIEQMDKKEDNSLMYFLGGAGALLLTFLTLGRGR